MRDDLADMSPRGGGGTRAFTPTRTPAPLRQRTRTNARTAAAWALAVTLGTLTACWCVGQADALLFRDVTTRTNAPVDGTQKIFNHRDGNEFGATDYETGWVPVVNAPGNGMLCGSDSGFSAAGSIVLVKRGTCRFVSKGLTGQLDGALGVVIGSGFQLTGDSIVAMSRNDSDPEADLITIPVVSISQDDFDYLSTEVINAGLRNETAYADLNAQGLVTDAGSYMLSDGLKFLTILILVLPALWLSCFLVYWARRTCAARVNRVARVRVAAQIPLVPFHREAHMTVGSNGGASGGGGGGRGSAGAGAAATTDAKAAGGSVGAVSSGVPSSPSSSGGSGGSGSSGGSGGAKRKIHNDACSVCLDDFKDGEMVKVLPCQHAFHGPCIDPWLDERSDTCPTCKQSIIITAQQHSACDVIINSFCCLPCVMCVNRLRGRDNYGNAQPNANANANGNGNGNGNAPNVPIDGSDSNADSGGAGAVHGSLDRANSSGFQPLQLTDEPTPQAGAARSPAVGHVADAHIAPSTPRDADPARERSSSTASDGSGGAGGAVGSVQLSALSPAVGVPPPVTGADSV